LNQKYQNIPAALPPLVTLETSKIYSTYHSGMNSDDMHHEIITMGRVYCPDLFIEYKYPQK